MRLYRLSAIVLSIACASTAAAQEPPAKRPFPEKYEVPKTPEEVKVIRLLGACRDPRDVPRLAAVLDEPGADDGVRLIALKALWGIEYVRRDIRWTEPRLEREYLDYMQKYPAPDKRK